MRQVTGGEGGEGNALNIVQCIKISIIIIFKDSEYQIKDRADDSLSSQHSAQLNSQIAVLIKVIQCNHFTCKQMCVFSNVNRQNWSVSASELFQERKERREGKRNGK